VNYSTLQYINDYNYYRHDVSGQDDLPLKRKWNTLSSNTKRVSQGMATQSYMNGTSTFDYFGQPGVIYARQTAIEQLDWPSAYTKSYDKMKSSAGLGDFNALVSLAEISETIKMISSLSTGVIRSGLSLHKGDIASALRHLLRATNGSHPGLRPTKRNVAKLKGKDISAQWLALQYGWLPLLGDIFSLLEQLDAMLLSQGCQIHGTTTHRVVTDKPVISTIFGPYTVFMYGSRCTGTFRTRISSTLSRDVGLADAFGITNPLSVVWEVIPFSFVFDWFADVGSYLDNRALAPLLKNNGTWRSNFWYFQNKMSDEYPYSHPPDSAWVGLGFYWQDVSMYRHEMIFDRFLVSDPVPTVHFRALSKAFSLVHLENAAALIHQLLPKGKK
jgi:hypothetical protein